MKKRVVCASLVCCLLLGACGQRQSRAATQSESQSALVVAAEPATPLPAGDAADTALPEDGEQLEADDGEEDAEQGAEDTPLDSAVAEQAISEHLLYPSLTQSPYGMTGEYSQRVGSPSEQEELSHFVASLDVSAIEILAAEIMPNDMAGPVALSDRDLADILARLQQSGSTLLDEGELENPPTGGGWCIYCKGGGLEGYLLYNGMLLYIPSQSREMLVFQPEGTGYDGVGELLWRLADEQ